MTTLTPELFKSLTSSSELAELNTTLINLNTEDAQKQRVQILLWDVLQRVAGLFETYPDLVERVYISFNVPFGDDEDFNAILYVNDHMCIDGNIELPTAIFQGMEQVDQAQALEDTIQVVDDLSPKELIPHVAIPHVASFGFAFLDDITSATHARDLATTFTPFMEQWAQAWLRQHLLTQVADIPANTPTERNIKYKM